MSTRFATQALCSRCSSNKHWDLLLCFLQNRSVQVAPPQEPEVEPAPLVTLDMGNAVTSLVTFKVIKNESAPPQDFNITVDLLGPLMPREFLHTQAA